MVSTVSAVPQSPDATSSESASSLQYLTPAGTDSSPNQSLLPLGTAVNEKDHLVVGGCDVIELVQEFGSPLYILDEQTLRTACQTVPCL